jgi:hypothetical protein
MAHHVHILDDTGVIGTVRLDHHGRAIADTDAAKHFVLHQTHRGHDYNNGEDMLKALVDGLDKSTYISAVHCHDVNHDEHRSKKKKDVPESTEATPVQNPEDHWPDAGEVSDSDKHRDINISNDFW